MRLRLSFPPRQEKDVYMYVIQKVDNEDACTELQNKASSVDSQTNTTLRSLLSCSFVYVICLDALSEKVDMQWKQLESYRSIVEASIRKVDTKQENSDEVIYQIVSKQQTLETTSNNILSEIRRIEIRQETLHQTLHTLLHEIRNLQQPSKE